MVVRGKIVQHAMPLSSGTQFGPYEITALLGAGGMGEVYRARDSKLGRDVALKVLSPALASDADHMARFTREAQVLASLNHPNIAAIYGLERSRRRLEPCRPPVDITEAPSSRATLAESSVDPSSTTMHSSGEAADCFKCARQSFSVS